MKNTPLMAVLVLSLALAQTGCQPDETSTDNDEPATAINTDVGTCAACGMVMREQPAPRGQVIHRDGTRAFMCSIDDLVQYLDIPSPHGKAAKIYAEVLPDDHSPQDMERAWQPWFEAAEVFFVIGIERVGVMGEPVMTFRTRAAAEKATAKSGGEVVSFEQLRQANRD